MRHAFRKGFTIVELMMVIGILAVLMTIVTSAATGAVRQARTRKAEALCTIVEQGLNTYHALYNEWPAQIANSVPLGSESYVLSNDQVDRCCRALVWSTVKNNSPCMDITGLFVCKRSTADSSRHPRGMDIMEAVRGTKANPTKMRNADDMAFGYPDSKGDFHRFTITYSVPSDSIKVTQ